MMQDGYVLLVKREEEPLKGWWYLPGGRVRRGETLEAAAQRLVINETGYLIDKAWPIGVDEGFYGTDPFGHGNGTHTVSVVCRAEIVSLEVKTIPPVKARWVNWAKPGRIKLHAYVKRNVRRYSENTLL